MALASDSIDKERNSTNPRLVVVALSLFKRGLSGGDVRLRAMLQRWQSLTEITCLCSPAGASNMKGWEFSAEYLLSSGFPESLRERSDLVAWLACVWFAATMVLRKPYRFVEPDIIYVQTDFLYEAWVGVALKKRYPRARLVALTHHSHKEIYAASRALHHLVLHWLQRASYRLFARYADIVQVYPTETGDICRTELIACGVDPDRIVTMWNGIDLDVIKSVANVEKEYDACVIGLRKNKGLDDVVDVWSTVCRQRPDARLYVLGSLSAVNRRVLDSSISAVGLQGRIVLGGHFAPPELYREIKRARVCLAPTHQEPYGIAVCEAMACGLPVVGYALANYERLHPGVFSVASRFDAGELGDRVVQLLGNDDDLREASTRSLAQVEQFDNDLISSQDWKNVLQGIVS